MKIGLFFGSFNPIHTGHLIIANYFAENTDLRQVWFVISPQNPLKNKASLLGEKQRLYMVNLAIEDNPKFRSSTIEFHLPQPSYTVDTLAYLKEKYPDHSFVLLMGSDNLETLPKWKNYELILKNYPVYVFSRTLNIAMPPLPEADIKIFTVPLLDISSTYIRNSIKDGKSVRYLVPESIYHYLSEMNFYKK